MRAFLTVWAVWLAAIASASGQMNPCPAAKRAAIAAKATQTKLLKVKSDWMGLDTALPQHSEEIVRLKEELVRVVDAQVDCASLRSSSLEPGEMQKDLASILDANKPERPVKPITGDETEIVDDVLGASLKLTAIHPNGIANLIAVEVQFGIECGYDTVLLVYERSASTWQRVIRWQRGRYDNPGDAFGDFFSYAVLPDTSGTANWRMVVAHGLPWCMSRFSAFEVDLLQPRRDKSEQRTIWHYKEGYSRFDTDPHIEVKRNGFELRLPFAPLDFNSYTLPGVFRFRVEGDRVERVQPVATNGRGFVDVWLQIDWNDARKWSDAAGLADLKTLHDRFAALYADTKDITTYTYGPVLGCSDKQHFQVEVNMHPSAELLNDSGIPTYYQIRQEQNGFTMLSASAKTDVRCGGHDLMAKR